MVDFTIIAAIARNNAIGINGKIPWSIREDFVRFKKLTMGYPCIMGIRTYKSFPKKSRPLPKRENIVLTSDSGFDPDNVTVYNNFNDAIKHVKSGCKNRAFLIGGSRIYKAGLDIASVLELTVIDRDYDADTFFPNIDFSKWRLAYKENAKGVDRRSKEKVSFSFITYYRCCL
jgi:dihydrofolate reductase